jgi:hypothetical protein
VHGFSRIFLLGILIFKGLIARRLYKSFGVEGLNKEGELKAGRKDAVKEGLGVNVRYGTITLILKEIGCKLYLTG